MELTEQQKIFVKHFLEGCGSELSAIRAGYSEKHAKAAGLRLLRNPRVAKQIETGQNKIEVLSPVGAIEPISNPDWIMVRLESIADFSLKKVAEVMDGELIFKPLTEWDDGSARALQSVKSTIATKPDGTRVQQVEYKFESKIQALDKLGQYHGIWMGFDQVVSGLKAYGIELVRDGDQFLIKQSNG